MFIFTVTPDDGEPFKIKASTRDVLVWEKAGRDRSMAGLVGDMHIADVYAVAHIAARRQQVFTGTLDEFEKGFDLTVVQDEEADPTRSAQSPGG